MHPGGRHFRKNGATPDEILQAMAVAESLIACRGFNQKDLVSRLFSVDENRPEWYGPATPLFFDQVKTRDPAASCCMACAEKGDTAAVRRQCNTGIPLITHPSPTRRNERLMEFSYSGRPIQKGLGGRFGLVFPHSTYPLIPEVADEG